MSNICLAYLKMLIDEFIQSWENLGVSLAKTNLVRMGGEIPLPSGFLVRCMEDFWGLGSRHMLRRLPIPLVIASTPLHEDIT